MLKSKLAVFLSSAILAGSVFASAESRPEACPSIAVIQAEGITMGYEIMTDLYAGISSSHFDTPENWIFTIGPLNVVSEVEAIAQGNQYLPTVSGNPMPKEHDGVWYCRYESGASEYQAMAFQADEPISPSKFKHYLNKSA